ncbi:dephospho-CoA kinase [Sulfuritalea sp.]|uniref:dephospho-CoA kinase n=1 Tax=Sulfuritalea sp. TaxID=2480090 RepID=UPI00286E04F5|nr:dephospho-CoA kinase [Sulfuritalea sp.]
MSYVVGLTGGIGSGKSAVADLFAERGILVVDTDAVAHALTAPGGAAMPAIRAEFGEAVAAADGALDRAAMRARVFADGSAKTLARKRLEAILHPMIRSESERLLAADASRSPYAILMVPLLIEAGSYRERVDRIAVVDCAEATQIARVISRNGLAREEVQRILAAQATRAERLAAADDVIDNDGDLAALRPQIERLHVNYLAYARNVG